MRTIRIHLSDRDIDKIYDLPYHEEDEGSFHDGIVDLLVGSERIFGQIYEAVAALQDERQAMSPLEQLADCAEA